MKIITAPHPTLRKKSKPIKKVDTKLLQFIKKLKQTLESAHNPEGVGLAAPQVNKSWRLFATRELDKNRTRLFINPTITKHSQNKELGENKKPQLEGCLSLPDYYAPVPRWQWVDLEFAILENDQLITKREKFIDFKARVVQHELDHLDGILFIDHSLEHDLPVYKVNEETQKLEEIVNRKLLSIL